MSLIEPYYQQAFDPDLDAPDGAAEKAPKQESGGVNPVHVVLDNIRSAFNVGSILRTADAGSAAQVHLCGITAHPPNIKLAKTALGAQEYVRWKYHAAATEALDELRTQGTPTVAIEITHDAVSHFSFDWPKPVAVVFGNEVTGVSPDILTRCDRTVHIPMLGQKRTINVATAFGIVLYEILRQWKVFS